MSLRRVVMWRVVIWQNVIWRNVIWRDVTGYIRIFAYIKVYWIKANIRIFAYIRVYWIRMYIRILLISGYTADISEFLLIKGYTG